MSFDTKKCYFTTTDLFIELAHFVYFLSSEVDSSLSNCILKNTLMFRVEVTFNFYSSSQIHKHIILGKMNENTNGKLIKQ